LVDAETDPLAKKWSQAAVHADAMPKQDSRLVELVARGLAHEAQGLAMPIVEMEAIPSVQPSGGTQPPVEEPLRQEVAAPTAEPPAATPVPLPAQQENTMDTLALPDEVEDFVASALPRRKNTQPLATNALLPDHQTAPPPRTFDHRHRLGSGREKG
jgi:hypothetical protein